MGLWFQCNVYVTICTDNRVFYFGDVVDGKMILNDIGEIAQQCWFEIPNHFPYVKLGEFVVMPNHVHGVIIIDKPICINCCNGRGAINRASTDNNGNKIGGFAGGKNPMLNENLSRIIRWYKGRITNFARKINPNFAWQSRFYDHIIRDYESYQRISVYILKNPLNWKGR